MESADSGGQVAPAIQGLVDRTRIEPQVLVPFELTPTPDVPAPQIQVARLELPPRGQWRPPVGPCQDVLTLVREGELLAVGVGVAPPEAPSTLYRGDAVRFASPSDGVLLNLTDQPARAVVAFVRAEGSALCRPETSAASDPFLRPLRTTSVRTTEPLVTLGGALRVHVLLDEAGVGARFGGMSVLRGRPGLRLPSHRHNSSAEILMVERGEGVLRLGDRAVQVRPGVALYIPAGTLHSFEGRGSEPFEAIQVYTPSGPEQRYRATD